MGDPFEAHGGVLSYPGGQPRVHSIPPLQCWQEHFAIITARSNRISRPCRKTKEPILCWTCFPGVRQNSSGTALILTFSPREKEQQAHGSGFANEHPANPVACFCGATADDSPSPGGEGRGEVEPQREKDHWGST